MKIKVDIYSGFLGAGKTMLMKKLIKDNVYEGNVAIIENEFGEVSIDGAILRESDIEVTEINAGCICCQVTGDFKKAILEVIEKYNPERILIEPSGVAKLTEVINIFKSNEIEEKVEIDNIITVIDSERFDRYLFNFKEFYSNQIANTKKIVLSRTQNVKDEDVEKVVKTISKINPKALIVKDNWDNINGKEILTLSRDSSVSIKGNRALKGRLRKESVKEENNFESFAVYLNRKTSKEELFSKFKFISSCSSYGEVLRAKGIVKLMDGSHGQFDFVKDEFVIRSIKAESSSVISFIGVNLNKDELGKIFK